MTRAQMRAGLELLPTLAPEQKTAANRQIITVMRQHLAAGDTVAPMYQSRHSPGWSDMPRSPRN